MSFRPSNNLRPTQIKVEYDKLVEHFFCSSGPHFYWQVLTLRLCIGRLTQHMKNRRRYLNANLCSTAQSFLSVKTNFVAPFWIKSCITGLSSHLVSFTLNPAACNSEPTISVWGITSGRPPIQRMTFSSANAGIVIIFVRNPAVDERAHAQGLSNFQRRFIRIEPQLCMGRRIDHSSALPGKQHPSEYLIVHDDQICQTESVARNHVEPRMWSYGKYRRFCLPYIEFIDYATAGMFLTVFAWV